MGPSTVRDTISASPWLRSACSISDETSSGMSIMRPRMCPQGLFYIASENYSARKPVSIYNRGSGTATMSVRKLLDLTGKIALVTGGSRGLGLQIAEALGEMGAKLAISARKSDELEQAREVLPRQSIEALTLVCAISRPEAI